MITRREFLKFTALSTGALILRPDKVLALPEFPQSDRLGRITVGKMDVYARPNGNDTPIGALYEDQVIPWLREVVGSMPGRTNQRFVETPYGYVWGGYVQPVWNKPNAPITEFTPTSLGLGMWVEITVPYVDLILENPPARAPWLEYRLSIGQQARFFYGQVAWVYTEHVYAFEIASVILLLAIVAAITLTMRKRPGLKVQDIVKQVAVRREDRVRIVKVEPSREP